MATTEAVRPGFTASLRQLRSAQKSSKGAPPYSLYVNRPLGRVLAAGAYQLGLTPNQVTYISAAFTFAGIAVLALVPPGLVQGIVVALALVLGYAFDSADGQLARLRGGGSAVGEWLDHMIDSAKIVTLHLAVLVSAYRFMDLPSAALYLVPMVFAIVSAVHFFGMILIDQLTQVHHARAGTVAQKQAASTAKTLLKLPTDYGILCVVFLTLGAPALFFGLYTFLTVATAGYLVLIVRKWRNDVAALDARTAASA